MSHSTFRGRCVPIERDGTSSTGRTGAALSHLTTRELSMTATARLTPEMIAGLPMSGPTDPIEYYRKPYLGWVFRERINRGLSLLPERRFKRVLEVGFGAGAVLLALGPIADEIHAIDLDADPDAVSTLLAHKGMHAQLRRGNVLDLPYPDAFFDLVVSFSVFEHLHDYVRALDQVSRVLSSRGLFLLGMPTVTPWMEAGFAAIGFSGIKHHHVTTPAQVAAAATTAGFRRLRSRCLDLPAAKPFGLRLYHNHLLEKP
jgi:SAM-dependent methyltransferase